MDLNNSINKSHTFFTRFSQVLIILGVTIICGSLFSLLGGFIAQHLYGVSITSLDDLNLKALTGNEIKALKLMQFFSLFGLFLLPALIIPFFIGEKPVPFLHIKKHINLRYLFYTILIFFLIYPIVALSIYLNQLLVFPESLKFIEVYIKEKEEILEAVTQAFLKMETGSDLVLNIFLIAVLPAIAEEFFFRGLVQSVLQKWTKHIHLSVILTAVIFSAIHFQFYGFLPRMFLGVFFGYLLIRTKNIWYPVAAHFLNNMLAVVYSWLTQKGIIDSELMMNNILEYPWILNILAILGGLLLIYTFYKLSGRKKDDQSLGPDENWSKVYTTNEKHKAEIVVGLLESHEINAVIMNKRDSAYQVFGEIDVYVNEKDFFEAKEVLLKSEL